MNPVYEPSNLAHTLLALVFYVFMAGFAVYSILAIYALMKFGKSKSLGLIVSLFYIVVIAGLFSLAVTNLNNVN